MPNLNEVSQTPIDQKPAEPKPTRNLKRFIQRVLTAGLTAVTMATSAGVAAPLVEQPQGVTVSAESTPESESSITLDMWNDAVDQYLRTGDSTALEGVLGEMIKYPSANKKLKDRFLLNDPSILLGELEEGDFETAKSLLAEIDTRTIFQQITSTPDWQAQIMQGGIGLYLDVPPDENDYNPNYAMTQALVQVADNVVKALGSDDLLSTKEPLSPHVDRYPERKDGPIKFYFILDKEKRVGIYDGDKQAVVTFEFPESGVPPIIITVEDQPTTD